MLSRFSCIFWISSLIVEVINHRTSSSFIWRHHNNAM
jgi:hypothetical protein